MVYTLVPLVRTLWNYLDRDTLKGHSVPTTENLVNVCEGDIILVFVWVTHPVAMHPAAIIKANAIIRFSEILK